MNPRIATEDDERDVSKLSKVTKKQETDSNEAEVAAVAQKEEYHGSALNVPTRVFRQTIFIAQFNRNVFTERLYE